MSLNVLILSSSISANWKSVTISKSGFSELNISIYSPRTFAIFLMSSSGVFFIIKLIALSPLTYDLTAMSEKTKDTFAKSFNLTISPFLLEKTTIFSTPYVEVFLLFDLIIISSLAVFMLPPEISILLNLIAVLTKSKLILCLIKADSSISTEIIMGA